MKTVPYSFFIFDILFLILIYKTLPAIQSNAAPTNAIGAQRFKVSPKLCVILSFDIALLYC